MPKPIVWHFAKRYVSGVNAQSAFRNVEKLNKRGIKATLDILGEMISSIEEAESKTEAYINLLEDINKSGLDSTISIKLTQLGLKISKEKCFNFVKEIVEKAKSFNNSVTIDIEDSTCTDDTYDIYSKLVQEYNNVWSAIQSYLRRSIKDINTFIRLKSYIRVCKGIYNESPQIAFKEKELIDLNFVYLVEKLLSGGCFTAIATHDCKIILNSIHIIDKLSLPDNRYEFQMLYGVNSNLQNILISDGFPLRIYVPFGKDWFPYSIRRFKENPKLVNYIFKNLFKSYKPF